MKHYPFREWCRHCMDGKGQNSQHRRDKEKDEEKLGGVPRISFDYWFMGEEDFKAQKNPLMMMYDKESTAVCPFAVGKKGVQDWVVRKLAKELEGWGLTQCKSIYKSDGEPSVVTVKKAVNAYLQNQAVMEESPVGEHASNGEVESAIKVVRNQFKVLRSALEGIIKERIGPSEPILQWFMRWIGQMLNRFRVDKNGRTAYEII